MLPEPTASRSQIRLWRTEKNKETHTPEDTSKHRHTCDQYSILCMTVTESVHNTMPASKIQDFQDYQIGVQGLLLPKNVYMYIYKHDITQLVLQLVLQLVFYVWMVNTCLLLHDCCRGWQHLVSWLLVGIRLCELSSESHISQMADMLSVKSNALA